MAKYRYVYTSFWEDPKVTEKFTPEDKLFFIYLLTNPHTTQIGIYKITKKLIAFEMGYSIESVDSLMVRFVDHHKLIRYNAETREIAIKNWGKFNLNKGGKPIIDCVNKELTAVEDRELIDYVSQGIKSQTIRNLFLKSIGKLDDQKPSDSPENDESKIDENNEELGDTPTYRERYVDKTKTKTKTKTKIKSNSNNSQDENNIKPVDNMHNVDNSELLDEKSNNQNKIPYAEIVQYLNSKAETNYRATTESTRSKIKARWNDGFRLNDFKSVICKKTEEWTGTDMERYLRPETLFGPKFESYLNQKVGAGNTKNNSNKSTFNNFKQRDYDFKELENKLLGIS